MFLAYVPVLVSFVPSPARLLCLMDPLLPFGFMMRCLKGIPVSLLESVVIGQLLSYFFLAYACPSESGTSPSVTNEEEILRDAMDLTPMSTTGFTESETESFEEVTESDLMELVAHKSPVSDASDTLTTVSLASSQHSKPEADQFFGQRNDELNGDLKLDLSNDEKYVFDSEIKDGKKVAVIRTEKSVSGKKKEKPSGLFREMKDNMSNLISNTFTSTPAKAPEEQKKNVHILDSSDSKDPSEEFRFTVPKDPFLSPYWAPDDVLRQLPPTSICVRLFLIVDRPIEIYLYFNYNYFCRAYSSILVWMIV